MKVGIEGKQFKQNYKGNDPAEAALKFAHDNNLSVGEVLAVVKGKKVIKYEVVANKKVVQEVK